jgi:putative aldouronate transport system permease protein
MSDSVSVQKIRKAGSKKNSLWTVCLKQRYLILMVVPGVVVLLLFHYYPIYGLQIAFKNFNIGLGITGSPWAEPITKWFSMFLKNPLALRLFRNTLLLGLYSMFWGFPAPIVLALIINEVRGTKFKRLVQTITYLPHFISTVIIVGLVKEIFSFTGPINALLTSVGLSRIHFMTEPDWFRSLFIGSAIWQGVGWGTIIYLAALSNIDQELYEAAGMDGANRLHKMFYITIPSIMPTVAVLFILNSGSMLNTDFQKIILMYNPQTYETADIVSTYSYREAFETMRYSYSAAVGFLMSLISFLFLWITNKVSHSLSENSLW